MQSPDVGREREPHAPRRAVEQAGRQTEPGQFPAEPGVRQIGGVRGEREIAAAQRTVHSRGGERTVFERERNALAHQRFGSRGVADQHDARRRQRSCRGVPADRKGTQSGRCRGAAGAVSGDVVPQPSEQRRLGPRVGAGVRTQRVGADVDVRRPLDQAGKRPQIAAQAGPDRAEIEVGTAEIEAVPSGRGHGHVAHQSLADGPRRRPDQGTADATAGTVGPDHDTRPVTCPFGLHAHGVRLADETPDLFGLADFGAACGRGAEQQIVELVAADDDAHVVFAAYRPVGRDVDAGALGPHVRHVERDAQVTQAVERMRNQPAGADLFPRMHGLVQQQDTPAQRRVGPQQVERGRGAGRTAAHDDDVVAVHAVRPGNAGFPPAKELTDDDGVGVRLLLFGGSDPAGAALTRSRYRLPIACQSRRPSRR